MIELPHHIEFDQVVRYVSALNYVSGTPVQHIPGYAELDVRVGWHATPHWEFSLTGQNLLHKHHPEFTRISEPQRGVYGRVTWGW
jgi:iron complex outermembrane receptor protein